VDAKAGHVDELIAALVLVALTVTVHAAGITILLRWVLRWVGLEQARFWRLTWVVIRTVWCLLAIHLIEIVLWALFFWQCRSFPDLSSAVYFSGVTYATVGYGDFVLPEQWRLLGPLEGLTGILMCGLSTGFFFALVSRLYAARKAGVEPQTIS
jgi:hypothetical protein